jgi:RimJ/RimL family protein N-acetyltransferase
MMQLLDVYSPDTDYRNAVRFLYQMLEDRDPAVNISHLEMPSFEQHKAFVESKPYKAWYIIEGTFYEDTWLGNCYLTHFNEIGVHILPSSQKQGYGRLAVKEIMKLHGPRRYLANVGNFNAKSQEFFKKLGFKLIQFTYEFEHAQD